MLSGCSLEDTPGTLIVRGLERTAPGFGVFGRSVVLFRFQEVWGGAGRRGVVFSCARRQHSFGSVLRTESESIEQKQVCSSCWEMLSCSLRVSSPG